VFCAQIPPRIPREGFSRGTHPLTFIQAAFELSAGAFPRHRVAHLVLLVVEREIIFDLVEVPAEYLPAAAAPTQQAGAKRSKAHSLSFCDG